MNGKMSKMLRKFRRTDHKSKKLLKSLDWRTRSKIRNLHVNNTKLMNIDFLGQVTGNYEVTQSVSIS